MAFGFPARFTESRTFQLEPARLFAIVKSAFESLGWSGYEILNGFEIYKQLRNSPLTWGEEFTIKILPGGTIQAESECSNNGYLPQIFDFGVNRVNVETFFAQVEQEIKAQNSYNNS